MNLSEIRDSYIRLTFNEANIIMENIRGMDQNGLLLRIKTLQENTEDHSMQSDLNTLLWKLTQMTPKDFVRLTHAAASGNLLFPGDYRLTNRE